MPTDLPARREPASTSNLVPIVLFSVLPWFVSLLLVHAYPAFAHAFVLMGHLS